MSALTVSHESLLRARTGAVSFADVPEFGFAAVTRTGTPGGAEFTEAHAAEGHTIAALHRAIAEAGCQPRGRHHEICLGDPRRSAPERLRTILRQPVGALEERA